MFEDSQDEWYEEGMEQQTQPEPTVGGKERARTEWRRTMRRYREEFRSERSEESEDSEITEARQEGSVEQKLEQDSLEVLEEDEVEQSEIEVTEDEKRFDVAYKEDDKAEMPER